MGHHQTFDWIFFAIVVPTPFLAALELLKTRFFPGSLRRPG